jgi:hypothetical protein
MNTHMQIEYIREHENPIWKKDQTYVKDHKITPTFLFHVHEKFDLQLQCKGIIVRYQE